MLRARKAIVILCIAVVIFAAFVPRVAASLAAAVTPPWLLFPAVVVRVLRPRLVRDSEQPLSLRSLVHSRAPPAKSLIV